MRARFIALTFACSLLALAVPADAADEQCGSQACVSGAGWSEGEQLSDSVRKREAKKNGKKKSAQLTVQIGNGRGSVFVDGVWLAPAPVLYVPIKPGKHDLEVRDGERVRARGVLSVPSKGGDVNVRVY